jgi:EF hand associated
VCLARAAFAACNDCCRSCQTDGCCAVTQSIASQLSAEAVDFLALHFRLRTDPRDPHHGRDGRLPLALLLEDSGTESFFHCAPPATSASLHPLGVAHVKELMVDGADGGSVPLESYLGVWAYCTLVDARKAAAAMLYLGYPDTYMCASVPSIILSCDSLRSTRAARPSGACNCAAGRCAVVALRRPQLCIRVVTTAACSLQPEVR